MALITCPECGNKVSDNASCCPKCGNPIKDIDNIYELSKKYEKEKTMKQDAQKKKIIIGFVIVFITAILLYSYWYKVTEPERLEKSLEEGLSVQEELQNEIDEMQEEYDENQKIIDYYNNN